jgi:hypothetical protein
LNALPVVGGKREVTMVMAEDTGVVLYAGCSSTDAAFTAVGYFLGASSRRPLNCCGEH